MAPFGFSGECSALNWQEYWIPEIEPLAQRIRSDIEVRGGVVVEGAQVRRIKEIEASRCIVEAHMAATGERHQIAPRHVIEATGPGYSGLSTRCRSAVPIVTGFNVVLELPLNASWAFGTPPSQRTGRSYFLIPYARQLLIGTGYVAGAEGDGSRPADTQVHSMVSDVASLVPGLGVTPDRISDVLWNDLPAKKAGVGYPSAKDSIVVSRTLPSRETYLRLYPSKLTTTPVVAASAIKKLSIKSNDSTS